MDPSSGGVKTDLDIYDDYIKLTMIAKTYYTIWVLKKAATFRYQSANANKKLYNAGSEWQDDVEGLADYYSTYFREYDPVIGRFNGVDILSVKADNWSVYAYSNDNPINYNDPLGDQTKDPKDNPFIPPGWYGPSIREIFDDRMREYGSSDWAHGGSNGGGVGSTGYGGMSEYEHFSSYEGLKSRMRNHGIENLKYGHNKFGDFGYWSSGWKNGMIGEHGMIELVSLSRFTLQQSRIAYGSAQSGRGSLFGDILIGTEKQF